MRLLLFSIIVLSMTCPLSAQNTPAMTLTIPGFPDGGQIPVKFSQAGPGDQAHWVDLTPSASAFETRANVIKAIQDHILAKAVYEGLFRRPR
jgi:hypothetical protein